MSMLRDNLPYTETGMKHLASALGITTSQFWINPTTSSLSLKTEPQQHLQPALVIIDEVED